MNSPYGDSEDEEEEEEEQEEEEPTDGLLNFLCTKGMRES